MGGGGTIGVREDFVNCAFSCKSLYCPTYQAAFSVGYPEDLWDGFPNHSVYWHTIEVFGVKRFKGRFTRYNFVTCHKLQQAYDTNCFV